jgi:cation:H+ antiporter
MTPSEAAPLFLVSLVITLGAAGVFARRLDRVGLRLGLPETLLGLLTALASDSPEVSSAITALVKGEHGVAVGVVVGSNAFNLAAMLGLGAIVATGIRVAREALFLEAFVGLWVTLVVFLLVAGVVGAVPCLVLVAVVVVPYVGLLAIGPRGIRRLRLDIESNRFLLHTFGEGHRAEQPRPSREQALLVPSMLLLADLVVIVAGSVGMVSSAVVLADAWGIPRALVGVLGLAILTSLPNAATGVRFARQQRGSALISETLNSNSINLVVGLAIPAVFASIGAFTALTVFDLVWLVVMTIAAVVLFGRRGGPGHLDGAFLIALYGVFVIVQLVVLA